MSSTPTTLVDPAFLMIILGSILSHTCSWNMLITIAVLDAGLITSADRFVHRLNLPSATAALILACYTVSLPTLRYCSTLRATRVLSYCCSTSEHVDPKRAPRAILYAALSALTHDGSSWTAPPTAVSSLETWLQSTVRLPQSDATKYAENMKLRGYEELRAWSRFLQSFLPRGWR